MNFPSSEGSGGPRLTPEAAEALAAKLLEAMIAAWRAGNRPRAEDLLTKHPALWGHPEAAADLIYEELCLRHEYGEELAEEEVLKRFPQWRAQLKVLLDCQRALALDPVTPPLFPELGANLGNFILLHELGRGPQSRVFLASQLSLADRPVVLKLTLITTREHFCLARLQHSHIIPLYSIQDDPAQRLRLLCMPYFGGATFAQLLEVLRPITPAQRTGECLRQALERVQTALPLIIPAQGPNWRILAGSSYLRAICWLGACLADALQYAHERGLVHLDLKPSNVLLAADGTPFLLDFHLAQEPLYPSEASPRWIGGTPGYMSPEQQQALLAMHQGKKLTQSVDGRSDVFSLGVVLYEALGGSPSAAGVKPRWLRRCYPQVSVGLADVVCKCLATDPNDRYPDMAALAADLRRHLAYLPLVGVRNRSLAERWQKWRQRRPQAMARIGMSLVAVTATTAVLLGGVNYFTDRMSRAHAALQEGQEMLANGEWRGGIGTLHRGLTLAKGMPLQHGLVQDLDERLLLAEQARAASNRVAMVARLEQLTDRMRFLYGPAPFPQEALDELEESCRAIWDNRRQVVERLSSGAGQPLEPVVRERLLEVAIVWADLQVRRASPIGKKAARQQALVVLGQAEQLLGPSCVLDEERVRHGDVRDIRGVPPSTAWEHYARARSLLDEGNVDRAAREAALAVRLMPQGLWPNSYLGACAYRQGNYLDAALAYSVCIGAAPQAAGCYYNRALALAALGKTEQALRDREQAFRLDPALAPSAEQQRNRPSRNR
jgi:serine/threonine protein kinase